VWGPLAIAHLNNLASTFKECKYPEKAGFFIDTYKSGKDVTHQVACIYDNKVIPYAYISSGVSEDGKESFTHHMGLQGYVMLCSTQKVSAKDYKALLSRRQEAKHIFEKDAKMNDSDCDYCDKSVQDCVCDFGLNPPTQKEYCGYCGCNGTVYIHENFFCQQCDDAQGLKVSLCDDEE
jgi:hypothetical protein